MTIAAGLLALDGLVLASDSATTIVMPDGRVSSVWTGGQKIFQLGMARPYGFAMFGTASFGTRNYRDLFTEFDATLGIDNPPVSECAQRFYDFAVKSWQRESQVLNVSAADLPATGFFFGGCGRKDIQCSFSEIRLRPNQASGQQPITHHSTPGKFVFEGCPWPVQRVLYGFDEQTWELVSQYIAPEKHSEVLQKLTGPSTSRPAPSPLLPLRDAIDYLHWMIHATIKYYKFIGGPPICGGKVEIACVTSDRGYRWVTHKSLDWNIGDREGQTEYSPVDPHRLGR